MTSLETLKTALEAASTAAANALADINSGTYGFDAQDIIAHLEQAQKVNTHFEKIVQKKVDQLGLAEEEPAEEPAEYPEV